MPARRRPGNVRAVAEQGRFGYKAAVNEALVIELPDLAATGRLAARLAALARPGDAIGLEGELGVGKTTFARAFISHLAGETVEVPSPTFNLVLSYPMPGFMVWHFDLYRVEHPEELAELGFDEALATGVALVEWPERLGAAWPADGLILRLESAAGEGRRARLKGGGDWPKRLKSMTANV